MSNGYVLLNRLKNGTAQSCTASAVTDVTGPVPMSSSDSLYPFVRLTCSAMSITNGITFRLQDTSDGTDWYAVGSEAATAAVKKTFSGGTREVTDLTWPATAAVTQADYLHVTGQDGTTYAVWLDIDANGTVPTGALYVAAAQKIKVSIVTGGTAADNAALARAAVVANAAWAADFTTSAVSTATFTITQVLGGAVADPAPKSENDGGAGSISVSVTTAGSNGGVNISTERLTSTAHGWVTGDAVIYTAGTTAVGGLTTGTTYYVIKVDNDTLKLATTQANAIAGTAIDLTDYGVGTQALYTAVYEINMLVNDSTDAAQLPVLPVCRVVSDNGASDTCTVSSVLFSRRQ